VTAKKIIQEITLIGNSSLPLLKRRWKKYNYDSILLELRRECGGEIL